MLRIAHLIAAVIATFCIAVFFLSTVSVELFASTELVAKTKSLIVFP